MSDDSDNIRNRRKRKTLIIEDSSESDSSVEITRRKRKKHRICVRDSDSDSDSSIDVTHKRRVGRVTSDTDQSSSGSEIIRSKRQVTTLASESGTDTSDSEYDSDWVTEPEQKQTDTKPIIKNESSSESGDDQLDKCPICLLPFKKQEVGSPESCDHSFCIDCILEWSKNVNTCPVDRQIYNLILVRSNYYNGKIVNQIPIETAQQQNAINEIVEDPTYCEICGSCDREERMLLCDGCDLGFHLECLDPPLQDIPAGLWFCADCGPGDEESTVDIYEVHLLLEDAETLGWLNGRRPRNAATRLIPRTSQSERVRARIITHRNETQRTDSAARRQQNHPERSNTRAGPSGSADRNASVRNRSSDTRRQNRRSRNSRIRITYEVDQVTGERIAIQTKIKRRRKRKNRKQREKARMVAQAMKSVKGRLALQLGMRASRNSDPTLIENRASEHANRIGFQRSQAGIPALHLFGRRDELDYYGGTDSDEDISSGNLLTRRRPQTSDVAMFRRAARRKALVAPPRLQSELSQQQQSTNVLDSILDIQSKFHSKNSVISLNQDGSVKIDSKDSNISDKNNNNKEKDTNSRKNGRNRINLNDYSNAYFRQTPMYGNNSSSSQSVYSNNADFTRRTNVDNRNTVSTSSEEMLPHGSTSNDRDENGQNYSLQRVCSSYEYDQEKKDKEKDKSRSNTPGTHNSDSELDIYSDIETVSTSRAEDFDAKASSPAIALTPNTPTDEDANNSDVDLIIDTEKGDDSKEQVTSTVDLADPIPVPHPAATSLHPNSEPTQNTPLEIQNQTVQSTNSKIGNKEEDEDDDSEDGCPNFSIYSSESMNIAKTTDLQLLTEKKTSNEIPNDLSAPPVDFTDETNRDIGEISLPPCAVDAAETSAENETAAVDVPAVVAKEKYSYSKPGNLHCGLYSDSDDETMIKITKTPFGNEEKAEEPELNALCETNEDENEKNTSSASDSPTKTKKSFALGDISNMTEDISEEERSYTPCLDERTQKQGLEGLDTEMISDEDRNDFDESHELKTASDGDALEINAKESELDFAGGKPEDYEEGEIVDKLKKKPLSEHKNSPQEKEPEKAEEKEESTKEIDSAQAAFKKLSKNNKERNYREKDKENARSKSKEKKSDKESKKERKKERRKEIERYNVRSMIAEKPRRVRDKFGRDESRRKSQSRSSRSVTPPVRRSLSRARSYSRERTKKRRARTKSRSRTPVEKRRSRSPRPRRPRSASSRDRMRSKWRRSRERFNSKSRQSASPRRRREWIRRSSKGWSKSLSRSYTPEQRLTPSWTPPRLLESQPVKPQNLTVILNNDHNKKRKEKRKRDKRKELDKNKKRKRNKTPPPSKEVFASGNNILVSVSFNKDKNQRDVINKRKRDMLDEALAKKRKAKEKRNKIDAKRKKKKKDLSGIKPVAIIDLERSPFREVTPSPEDVIVLTDSENAESNDMLVLQTAICDSSQQVASPERPMNANYLTGPKTPPEPQVKFTLNAKQTQIRAISNPLHEPDDIEGEIDPQEELEQRLNESLHKGPNTPPEPPNSPPSSPDAYDPFEPTKSRSPTPEPLPPTVQLSSTSQNESVREESLIDSRNDDDETIDQSHTPPVTDIQPADSQCSNIKTISPEKSPEQQHIGVVINRIVQSQASIFPQVASKSIPFSNASMVTSTPMIPPRINILNSTVLTPTTIASALPQRIVLPNTTKSSPVKVSPNKIPIKSTPIKPMPAKNLMNKSNKSSRKSNNHNANDNSDALLDFESPYSPGSSDYEDLFEPPPPNDVSGGKNTSSKQATQKGKDQSTFDVLFGSSPVNNCFKNSKSKPKGGNKYKKNSKGTKQVGVKIDEDTLKIMDELPNSAVEMQVKNKYLKKLNRQERVVEEVKLVLKPHYNKKHVNKEEYKDILRRAVPKICHNKSGEINPQKIQNLIEAYVKKIRHSKKVTSSSSVNPQKA